MSETTTSDRDETRTVWTAPNDEVWRALEGGPLAQDEETGECWQYMGSRYDPSAPDRLEHCFRHRAHPGHAGKRVYVWPVEVLGVAEVALILKG